MAASRGVLLDTGPLVAYLAADERFHEWATRQFQTFDGPIITCEAVISEAWFLLRHKPRHIRQLQSMLGDGVFDLSFHLENESGRVAKMMDRYGDIPMSLADACMVRLSEINAKLPLLTLDSDFNVYRRHGRQLIPVLCPNG
jgi:predicted nucleic acid-binding protein